MNFAAQIALLVAEPKPFLNTGGVMLLARRLIMAVGVFVLCGQAVWAQRISNWRVFKASDGLAESSVSSVSLSQRTNVLVWHSEANAMSSLDGYRVKHFNTPSLGTTKVYESRVGQIWAPYAQGLQEFLNGEWTAYPVKEIQQEYQTNLTRNVRPVSLVPLKKGHVLFLVSDRLMEFNNEWPPQAVATTVLRVQETALGKFSDMVLAHDGAVWIAGENGLLRSTNVLRAPDGKTTWEEFLPPPEMRLYNFQQPFPDDERGVVVIGESSSSRHRVPIHFNDSQWRVLPSGRENFRQAWRGTDGLFWAVSISTLFFLEPGAEAFTESSEISAGRFLDAAVEANGVFWLATSDGLFRHAPLLWRNPAPSQTMNSPVRSIWEDAGNNVWFANAAGLFAFEDEKLKTFPFPEETEPRSLRDETVFVLRNGNVVLDAGGHLLVFDSKTETYGKKNHPSGNVANVLGLMKDGTLAVQIFETSAKIASHLEIFDGERFQKFPEEQPPLAESVELSFLFAAVRGDIWLNTSRGLLICRDGKWQNFPSADGSIPEAVSCALEIDAEKIWFGARDQILEFDGKNWSSIRGGFDRVNALLKTRDGSIWAATSSGAFRYYQGTWILNSTEEGLPAHIVTRLHEDRRGRLWAGTTRGLSLLRPDADMEPPHTFISKGSRSRDGSFDLAFGGRDKWKYTPPEFLFYSYRLDEQEWSPFQSDRTVSFPDLSSGKHYFQVRAMDRGGNLAASPALLEFEIPLPWYKEIRLVLISLAGLSGIIFFAALAINRHRRLIRSYAEVEKTVALRTKQLREVNEQLLHSQKMTALGTLSAGIAHDFNNILSIIKGSAQIIETNLDDADKIKTRVERIKTVVDQGSGVVKAMLGFSRPSEKISSPCNINAVTEETIQLLGDRFLREVEVKFEPDKTLPEVLLAKDLVQQILLNFIFNAADALNGRGQIILKTGQMSGTSSHSVLSPAKSERQLYILVKDTGCGIPPDVLPRIFEPFFTTKALSARRGTGLGLSMVYQMAKDSGWGLAVDSEVGKGSTFTLIIPMKSS